MRERSRQVSDVYRNCHRPFKKHLMSPSTLLPSLALRLILRWASQDKKAVTAQPGLLSQLLSCCSFFVSPHTEKNKPDPKAASRSSAGGQQAGRFVLGWALPPIQSSSRQGPLEGTLSSPRTGCAGRAAVFGSQVFLVQGDAPAEIHASRGGAGSRGREHIYWEGCLQIWTAVQGPKAGLTERDDGQSTDRWLFGLRRWRRW